jgi:hypothetical protein
LPSTFQIVAKMSNPTTANPEYVKQNGHDKEYRYKEKK